MDTVQNQSVAQAMAWAAYRRAFADFSQRVREVQRLIGDPHPDRGAIEAALLELEAARAIYNRCRDAVADQLLRLSGPIPSTLVRDSSQAYTGRVRGIAELLWEVAGRPNGTADEDWYRAEEILRRSTVA